MKAQLIAQHNGRMYELESGEKITLELKPSWSKAKIELAIADFEAQITNDQNYREWKSSIAAALEVLHGYTIEDVNRGFGLDLKLQRSWQKKLSAAAAADALLIELRKHNSVRQIETLGQLGWEYSAKTNKFTHLYFNEDGVRLAYDCRRGDGFIVYPNGTYLAVFYDNRCQSIWGVQKDGSRSPVARTGNWKPFELAEVTVWVQMSESLAVEVAGTYGGLLQVRVYPVADYGKNPTWDSIELSQREETVWEEDERQKRMTFRLIRSSFNGGIELATRMNQGETLLLAIARDFDNFLPNPEEWLKNQPK